MHFWTMNILYKKKCGENKRDCIKVKIFICVKFNNRLTMFLHYHSFIHYSLTLAKWAKLSFELEGQRN